MAVKPLWYRGNYETRARLVCDNARANASTRCWRCGLTLAEVRALNPRRRIRWQAGHVRASDPRSPLLAEHSLCNERHGQALGEQAKMPNSKRLLDLLSG